MIKTQEEIEIMRQAGRILGKILRELEQEVRVGLEVLKLEEKFLDLCKKEKVEPACKNYKRGKGKPFPTGLCVSINDECVHCYPKRGAKLQDGDNVLLDTVIRFKGLHVDAAITVGVGSISPEKKRLLETTKLALDTAINQIGAGKHVGDISNTIQTVVEMAGFNVIREYTGHGIGREMHELPSIPSWGDKGQGVVLEEGMTITIEPLVCTGDSKVINKKGEEWETVMADGGNFAQFEHTVLVKKRGFEILTK
ncbi:MAG TPA: type I methionyl aminopeptidase [Candidatus Dojkabacteria bacterium]|jgi:methionyl aminopeptidase